MADMKVGAGQVRSGTTPKAGQADAPKPREWITAKQNELAKVSKQLQAAGLGGGDVRGLTAKRDALVKELKPALEARMKFVEARIGTLEQMKIPGGWNPSLTAEQKKARAELAGLQGEQMLNKVASMHLAASSVNVDQVAKGVGQAFDLGAALFKKMTGQ